MQQVRIHSDNGADRREAISRQFSSVIATQARERAKRNEREAERRTREAFKEERRPRPSPRAAFHALFAQEVQ